MGRPIAASVSVVGRCGARVARWSERGEYNRDRTFVLGFSAGMMMAAALVLDDPARFAGAVLLSGAIAFDAGIDAVETAAA